MTQDNALKILQSGKNVFLTGEPGSGKSYTINKFREWMDEQGIPYAITASTGIAATHIGGTTIHSWSGIGIKEEVTDLFVQNLTMNKPFAVKKICYPSVLIIDEISMLNANTLDNIEKILSGVRGTHITGEAFGGLQVVLVGDFFQLPPVSKFGKEVKFAFESKSWEKLNLSICYLTEQHRQSDPIFLDILTKIRQGGITDKEKKVLMSAFKGDEEAIDTRLFTHNLEVDILNSRRLQEIDKELFTFKMEEEGNEYLVSVMKNNCLSPELLKLKVGAVVMFTRNKFDEDSQSAIYVNGTIGVVEDLNDTYIRVRTVAGRSIEVTQAEWTIEENGVVKAAIRQYPLKLAWAITVHKSQGMSLDHARIDLSKTFEYGQGYVAISRVRDMAGLCLEGINDNAFEMHPKVTEIDQEFRKMSETITV